MIKRKEAMQGILIIDKPSGMTSHDVVEAVRRRFSMKKVGHAGTLDPMATGVLILLLGKATKLSLKFMNLEKEYEAEMILGAVTDTGDVEGKVTETFEADTFDNIKREEVEKVLSRFHGRIKQVPPMVSAIKMKGKKLYELARKGIEVKREPREININKIELVNFDLPRITFRVSCSKGTYVRQLCEDIARSLGTGAYQSKLRRLRIGEFSVNQAVQLEDLNEGSILSQ